MAEKESRASVPNRGHEIKMARLAALYDEYASMIYGMLLHCTPSKREAEVMLAEVFTEVSLRYDEMDHSDAMTFTWLGQMVRIVVKRHLQFDRSKFDEAFIAAKPEVNFRVHPLSDLQQKLFLYIYVQGGSTQEAAAVFSLPQDEVIAQLRLAISAMR